MLAKRLISLTLAILLTLGSGAGLSVNDAPPFAVTSQAALSAAPNSSDCSLCEDCAKPCVASVVCSTTCLSPGLASGVQGAISYDYSQRRTPKTGSQPSCADLLRPTPPPKLIRIA